jgi:hypothetical protein
VTPEGEITDPSVTLWGSESPAVAEAWEQWATSSSWSSVCPAGTEYIAEREGQAYPTCLSTGVFYAPPFTAGVLADLLWPSEWSIVPPE